MLLESCVWKTKINGKIVPYVNSEQMIINGPNVLLLTCSSQHFWCPSHCARKLIGWPFQSVILQSEAINFPMQHESIILMMVLVTGPYGHSAVRDLPGNLSNYALAKHLWDVTDWQRKESSLPKKMVSMRKKLFGKCKSGYLNKYYFMPININ